jgi:histidinol-phosphate/aromatic aminotransferase/cobyric acid decarboxylase-like protein
VITGEERKHEFFEPDEYTAINNRYFAGIRHNGKADLDPSGWIETLSNAAHLTLPLKHPLPLGRYYMDEGEALGSARSGLNQLLNIWEGTNVERDRFTVCPSVGVASLLTMAILRRRGVTRIVFETPCYFAAILQAEWLGFDVILSPTYRRNGYRRLSAYGHPTNATPTAWWLTHPRVTLGFNQEIQELQTLVSIVGLKDFIIIDEAMDQSFPSEFGALHKTSAWQRVIRLKGFGKSLGLNGYRLAFAIHAAELRADMVDCLETFAGAVDVHSIEAACAVALEPGHFKLMMNVANQQVVALRMAADRIAVSPNVVINPLVNGYLGSAVINLVGLGTDQTSRRHRFLLACKRLKMPVIIGPSMHFASDPPTEAVRLNFFSRREDILRCVTAMTKIAAGVI